MPPMPDPLLLDLPPVLETGRLQLRSPKMGDGLRLLDAANESLPQLRPFLAHLPWVATDPTPESTELYCRMAQASFVGRKDLAFFLFERSTGHLVGGCGLYRTVWTTPKTEIGYWLRSSAVGRGLATEAVDAMVAYAFEHFKAIRVELITDELNIASRKVAQRCQFTLEGILHNERRTPDGRVVNTCLYARFPNA